MLKFDMLYESIMFAEAKTKTALQILKDAGFKTTSSEDTEGAKKSWLKHKTLTSVKELNSAAVKALKEAGFKLKKVADADEFGGPEFTGPGFELHVMKDEDTDEVDLYFASYKKGPKGEEYKKGIDN